MLQYDGLVLLSVDSMSARVYEPERDIGAKFTTFAWALKTLFIGTDDGRILAFGTGVTLMDLYYMDLNKPDWSAQIDDNAPNDESSLAIRFIDVSMSFGKTTVFFATMKKIYKYALVSEQLLPFPQRSVVFYDENTN